MQNLKQAKGECQRNFILIIIGFALEFFINGVLMVGVEDF